MAKGSQPGTETISSSTSPIHPTYYSDISAKTTSRLLRPRSTSTTKATDKSSETMHQPSAALEVPLPITYTPTTHRISKAKKGKRVHACEYPGCTKVFTRAEHRRRHELNHNPEVLFQCSHPDCKKAFQRHDLLTRHMERHELEAQMENEAHCKQILQSPMVSEVPHMSKPMPDNASAFYHTTQQPNNNMSIESLVHLPLINEQPQIWNGMDLPLNSEPSTMLQEHHIPEPIENNPFYSYPESCASPSSDGTVFSLNTRPSSSISSTPNAVMDSYPEHILDCGLTSSPTPMHAELPPWGPSDADMSSSTIVPLSLDGEFIQPAHQYPSPTWARPYEPFDSAKEWSL